MTLHLLPLLILLSYAFGILVIANRSVRRQMGADHFLVAGRTLPLALVVAVVLGDWVGGASTIGVSQRGYTDGIAGAVYTTALALAMGIFAATMAARYRRLGAITVPEVVGTLFDTKTRLLSSLIIGVAYFCIGTTQIMAGGALLAVLLDVAPWLGELLSAVLFGGLIAAGGLRTIAVVNVMQVGVILFGTVITLWGALHLVGGSVPLGIERLRHELPPSYWSLTARPLGLMAGEVLSAIFTCFAAQAAITGVFSARDHQTACRGAWIAGVLLLPIGVAYAGIGMCARVYFGAALPFGTSAAPAMMLALPPWWGGVALCGLFAAMVSTGPLTFLAPMQILVRDVYAVYFRPQASDTQQLMVGRVLAGLLVAGGWLVAQTAHHILPLVFWAFALRGGIGIMILGLTYAGPQHVSADGAFWSLLAGAAVLTGWTLAGNPCGVHGIFPTAGVMAIAVVLLSRWCPRRRALSRNIVDALHPQKP